MTSGIDRKGTKFTSKLNSDYSNKSLNKQDHFIEDNKISYKDLQAKVAESSQPPSVHIIEESKRVGDNSNSDDHEINSNEMHYSRSINNSIEHPSVDMNDAQPADYDETIELK